MRFGLHASLDWFPSSTALAKAPFALPSFNGTPSHGIPRLRRSHRRQRPAGLPAALHLAPTHRVAVITKRTLQDGSSGWAQGGIAAVLADDDSFAAHIEDTLVAGAGLCDLATTRFVVENAPESIAWLRGLGVPFTLEGDQLHLTREGGHSPPHRRMPPTPPAQRRSAR